MQDAPDTPDSHAEDSAALIAAWDREGGFLSEAQLADYLSVDASTIKQWSADGLLPERVRIGRRTYRYSKLALARWLAQLREQAAPT